MGIAMRLSRITAIVLFSTPILSISFTAGLSAGQKKDTLKAGDPVPTFAMRELITDSLVFLRDFTGEKLVDRAKNKEHQVVILSFWATYCQPCKNEIPILTKIAEDFKDQPVKILLINTLETADHTEDTVRDVYQSRGYKLTCLLDATGRYAERCMVRVLPVMIVIDKYGIVRQINRGYHENFQIDLEKIIKELVEEKRDAKNK
jgi:thiol-disulfide isomerase/thioredoxin